MIYSGGDSVNSVNLDMKDLLKRWNRSSIFRRKTHTLKENDQENQTEDSPTAQLVFQMDAKWNMISETLDNLYSRIPITFEREELQPMNNMPQGLIQIIEAVLLGNEESEGFELGKVKKLDYDSQKRIILRIKTSKELKKSQDKIAKNGGYYCQSKAKIEVSTPLKKQLALGKYQTGSESPKFGYQTSPMQVSQGYMEEENGGKQGTKGNNMMDTKPVYQPRIKKKKKKKFVPPKRLVKPKKIVEAKKKNESQIFREQQMARYANEGLPQDPHIARFTFRGHNNQSMDWNEQSNSRYNNDQTLQQQRPNYQSNSGFNRPNQQLQYPNPAQFKPDYTSDADEQKEDTLSELSDLSDEPNEEDDPFFQTNSKSKFMSSVQDNIRDEIASQLSSKKSSQD